MIRMQFLVDDLDLSTKEEIETIKKGLESDNVSNIKILPQEKYIFVTTSLSSQEIIKLISKFNKTAYVHGQGTSECAVGVLLTDKSEAIIRFIQLDQKQLLIDGSFIRLPNNGDYTIKIHHYGDLTDPPISCGKVFFSLNSQNFNGEFHSFHQTHDLQVQDLIGKSIILYKEEAIAWSVIARSAGTFENEKKVCRCNPKIEDKF